MHKPTEHTGYEKLMALVKNIQSKPLPWADLAQNLSGLLQESLEKEIPDISKAFNKMINPSENPEVAKILFIKTFDYIKLNAERLIKESNLVNRFNPKLIFWDYDYPLFYDKNKVFINLTHFEKPISIWSIAFMLSHESFHHYLWHSDEVDGDRLLAMSRYRRILYVMQFTHIRALELLTDSCASSLCHKKWVPLNLMKESLTYFGTEIVKNNWL